MVVALFAALKLTVAPAPPVVGLIVPEIPKVGGAGGGFALLEQPHVKTKVENNVVHRTQVPAKNPLRIRVCPLPSMGSTTINERPPDQGWHFEWMAQIALKSSVVQVVMLYPAFRLPRQELPETHSRDEAEKGDRPGDSSHDPGRGKTRRFSFAWAKDAINKR